MMWKLANPQGHVEKADIVYYGKPIDRFQLQVISVAGFYRTGMYRSLKAAKSEFTKNFSKTQNIWNPHAE